MTSNKQSNNTIINQEVSDEFPKKLKEPEKFGFKDTETMTSNKQNNNTPFRAFIMRQLAIVTEGLSGDVSLTARDELDEAIEAHFNNYNQDIRDEVNEDVPRNRKELDYFQEVIDEAVDEFGYELIKGKSYVERMELFVYLEAKRLATETLEAAEEVLLYVKSGQQEQDDRKLVLNKIKAKDRGCDACFRDLMILPEAEHTTETFYVSGEGFENGEVQDDIDALFGINDENNRHKTLAKTMIKDAIDKYHARFGKQIYDKYEYLVKEREEFVRKAKVTDELIAELKKQLKDYHDNSYNGDEMEEKLEEREEQILDELCVGGEFEERYFGIVIEGRREILDALMEFREGLEE